MNLLPWLIWTLSSLFVVLNYVQQVFPNIITTELASALNVSESSLGGISAAYFYAYALLQIPVGLILDRFGVHRPLAIAILVASAGTFLFSQAHNASEGLLSRLLMGASFAFSFLGCLKLVQDWFPVSRFSTMAGMTNTLAMLGAACGAPLAMIVMSIGWRLTLVYTGFATFFLAILVSMLVRDVPPSANKWNDRTASPSFQQMLQLMRNAQVWINASYATTISLIFVAFGGLWGVDFIRKLYNLDAVAAATAGSLLFIGGIAGSIFFGWFSDYLHSRKKPMVFASIGGLTTLCVMLYIQNLPFFWFESCLFLIGFFSSANIISYAVARDLYPKLSGLSIGLLSTCFYVGSASSQPVVGYLLEFHSKKLDGGINRLTSQDYTFALSSLVVFMAISVLLSLVIKETMPVAKRQ